MNKQIFTLARKMLSMLYLTERVKKMFKKNTISERGLDRGDCGDLKRLPHPEGLGEEATPLIPTRDLHPREKGNPLQQARGKV